MLSTTWLLQKLLFYSDKISCMKHTSFCIVRTLKLVCNESRVQITTPSIYETRYARKTNTARFATPYTSEKWAENGPPFTPRYFPRAYKNMRSSLADFSSLPLPSFLFILTQRSRIYFYRAQFRISVFAPADSRTRARGGMHFRHLRSGRDGARARAG